MSWRSVFALLLLAFAGGAAAFAWLNSDGSLPWETASAPAAADDGDAAAAPAPAFPAPAIIQPSASQAETMLLVANARHMIEAGKPLGELGTRLQVSFGQSQPQALATIAAASRKPASNARLLAAFDSIASQLSAPTGTTWDRMRFELATLFVIRRADAEPSASAARIAEAREAIVAGDIAKAASIVRVMPGADHARDWLLQAKQAIAVRQAFDALNAAAAAPPPVAPPVATPAIEPAETAKDETLPAGGE
jgi:hypothetical protein